AAARFGDAPDCRAGGAVRLVCVEVRASRGVVKLHDGVPCTKHVITNLIVEVDEAAGAATARSYFTVLQAAPSLPLQPILAGRYHDRFARVADGWRFRERLIHVDLVGDLPERPRRPAAATD